MPKLVKQFEIWQINLNPKKGSEQAGIRPCLIIETNAVSNKGKTSIIIPITSNLENIFSFDVILEPKKENGLTQKSKLKFRQIRVIDKARLIKKIGEINSEELKSNIFTSLSLVFDFDRLFNKK